MKAIAENDMNTVKEGLYKSTKLSGTSLRMGTVCSCSCHCSLTQQSDSSSPANSDEDLNVEEIQSRKRSRKVRANRSLCLSNPRHAKYRHYSADHVTCIRQVEQRESTRKLSTMKHFKCRSSENKNPSCELCGCLNIKTFPAPGSYIKLTSDEEDCAPPPSTIEIYDRRLGKFLQPLAVSKTVSRTGSIRQSCSDPKLSTASPNSHYDHLVESTNDEKHNKYKGFSMATLTRRSKTNQTVESNSSLVSKLTSSGKKYASLSRLNKRNLSFRSFRKMSSRKLGLNPTESIYPTTGNVRLSAINKINNNVPLDELKEQIDVGGSYLPSSSHTKLNRQWGSRIIDGAMTASLRRRKKSFLEKYSVAIKVQPVVDPLQTDLNNPNVVTGITRVTAWKDEYADFDHLHHASCPCRNEMSKQLKDEMADVTAEMETLEGGEEGKNNPKNKQMSIGRKKFNMDPKKGIEYLIEHNLLKNTADDISKFLYNGEGLSKTAIGDYLGERHDFNQTVLESFVALHDFTDLILVQALRQFLWSFRLPGEAQKIDRMMERFAHHYCELNPSIFQHPDTCFVLSFAIIMLNTSLHNPAVRERDKQNLEQFINMNRSIDNGDDLPRELLESLYESIKTEPFKIPEDDGNDLMHTFFNPDREGWLWKQGGRYKSWKRRWFILNDNCLYYFEYTTDKEPRGIIPLENIEVREVHDRNKPHCFELYATSTDFIKACKTDSEGKVVEGKHTVYRMSASTHEEKEDWIKCIRQSISHNPFYDLLAKRKKNIQKNAS